MLDKHLGLFRVSFSLGFSGLFQVCGLGLLRVKGCLQGLYRVLKGGVIKLSILCYRVFHSFHSSGLLVNPNECPRQSTQPRRSCSGLNCPIPRCTVPLSSNPNASTLLSNMRSEVQRTSNEGSTRARYNPTQTQPNNFKLDARRARNPCGLPVQVQHPRILHPLITQYASSCRAL